MTIEQVKALLDHRLDAVLGRFLGKEPSISYGASIDRGESFCMNSQSMDEVEEWIEGIKRRFPDSPYASARLIAIEYFPNYSTDLNAVHDAEKTLTDEQYERFSQDLWNLVNPDDIRQPSHPIRCERAFLSASARQRSEALVPTLSKP